MDSPDAEASLDAEDVQKILSICSPTGLLVGGQALAFWADHLHVVPPVPQAVEILKAIPERRAGDYLFSSDGGRIPISGISKYYRTRLRNAIIANTGSPLSKEFTSHDLRRMVATRLAEALGEEGDKLIKSSAFTEAHRVGMKTAILLNGRHAFSTLSSAAGDP
ncbi:MAG TPA: hypothetical protein VFX20_12475 [Steroidobacteraceae bacterium]|nr:hypothetical protein [Steroidobacteraceae bacterium]